MEIIMSQADNDTTFIESVIDRYARTWTFLLQYDEDRLERPEKLHLSPVALEYDQAQKAIALFRATLINRGEASELLGQERGQYLQSILGNIDQTFDGQELHPTSEEKAAHLLYFVIKDHPFSDGNKRIDSLLFLLYLNENGLLEQSDINDNGLVTLALLVAESDPRQKDLLIRLVLNLLVSTKENH
jgi:prophage maintenance system killer protein